VLSGLKNGDRVVVDNIIKIRPGAIVSPTVVPLNPVATGEAQQTKGKEGQ
jgi:membrane fusion protein (multidrug efflux system)